MKKCEFQKRINEKFPDKPIYFESNECVNSATIENIMFYNNVYSDYIYIQWNNIHCGIMQD